MSKLSSRALISQLADDLGWLEQHCRAQPDLLQNASKLRLAAALVRNCIGPLLDEQAPIPLHLAVIGGAGAGKSTVANMLSGAVAAEANPQAGFTRHPIAYTSSDGVANWSGHLGFLGPLQRLTEPRPSSLDQDVYQVRRVPPDSASYDLLKDFVVWDCPDMTTWAATNYISRLLEASALADVLVYVASDERYNDEIPTQFLRLLLLTGKPVVVCLMKMQPDIAAELVAHFQKEVVSQLPPGILGTLAIPFLRPDQLADPARKAVQQRIPLINQIAVFTGSPKQTRQRSVYGALAFLQRQQEELLAAARKDVLALQSWQAIVQSGQQEFDQRYVHEYLTTEKFRGFDEALVRLIELLDLPGVGKILSSTLHVLRTPYRLLKGWITKAVSRPESLGRPEQPVLEEALTGWIDALRKESARRSSSHPLWAHVAQGFQSGGLAEATRERFQADYRNFQMSLTDEVERTARSIYEQLERNPVVLNSLRGGKFALDVAAIVGTVIALHAVPIWDIVLVPLVSSLTHQLVELLGAQVVESQREATRQRQQLLMSLHLSTPLAAWLTGWPTTGGSTFERLQLALRRIPPGIQQLGEEVRAKYEG